MSLLTRLIVVAVLAVLSLSPHKAFSQTTGAYTLKQAQDYAIKNNYRVKSSILDKEIARHTVRAFKSIGFPFIAANGSFQHFIDIPTSVVPGDAFGFPDWFTDWVTNTSQTTGVSPNIPQTTGNEVTELQFGSKYNSSGGISANQMIFDVSYLSGLKAAKTYASLSMQAVTKTELEIKVIVAQSYFSALAAAESIEIFEANKKNIDKTLGETKAMYEAGFVEEMDVEQLQLLASNLNIMLNNARNQAEISLKLLKFQMGLDVGQPIELSDNLSILVDAVEANIPSTEFSLQNHIDYQLAETQVTLMELNTKVEKSKFYPKLSGFFNYSQNAFRNDFDFFSGGKWYPTTLWGLNLSFPLFSGFGQSSVLQQAKLEHQKAEIQKEQVSQSLTLQEQSARAEYTTALESYQNQKKSLALAKTIQQKTSSKFKEGLASSMELTQAENQYFSVQGNYIQSIFKLLNAKAKLDKALNKT